MSKFKHAPAASYRREVTVKIPGDFGKFTETKIILRFKRHNHEELKTLLKKIGVIKDAPVEGEEAVAATSALVDDGTDMDKELMLENTLGWEGVLGSDDIPMEFSQENLAELMAIPCYRKAMTRALLDDMLYPEGKKAKN